MNLEDQDPLVDQFTAFRQAYPNRQISCCGMVWRYRAGGAADRPTVWPTHAQIGGAPR
jgi:hypothetical protein